MLTDTKIFRSRMGAFSCIVTPYPSASFFSGVRIRLGTILGRFSIIYFRGLGLKIRVRVWVGVRVSVRIGARVSVVLWSW